MTCKIIKSGTISYSNAGVIPNFWTGIFNKTLTTTQSVKAGYIGSSTSLPIWIVTGMILKKLFKFEGSKSLMYA